MRLLHSSDTAILALLDTLTPHADIIIIIVVVVSSSSTTTSKRKTGVRERAERRMLCATPAAPAASPAANRSLAVSKRSKPSAAWLLYTSDAADDEDSADPGGRGTA